MSTNSPALDSASNAPAPRPKDTGGLQGRQWLAVTVLIIAASLFFQLGVSLRATHSARVNVDEPFYLLTTVSLLEDGDLDLINDYELRRYEAFFDYPGDLWSQSVPNRRGQLLSPHNVGLSALIMPAYALGGVDGVKRFLAVLGGLTVGLAALLAYRATGFFAPSLAAAAVLGISAPFFVFATQIYPEMPAALLTAGCAWLLLAERPGWRIAIVLLLGISGIMWLGSKYGLICAALGLIGLMRLNMKGRLTLVVLTVAAGVAYGWFHLANYGGLTPYSVNVIYAGHSAPEVLGMHLEIPGRAYRLVGLWVDREFGVWRWAPALVLVLPGIPRLLRRTGTAWWLLVLVFGGALCTAAFFSLTMRGWWFPGRMLIVGLPLLAIPLAEALALARGRRLWGTAALLLSTYSLGVTLALWHAVSQETVVLAVDPFDMTWPPFAALSSIFPLYTSYDLPTWLLTAAWLVAGLALLFAGVGLAGWRHNASKLALTALPRSWLPRHAGDP